MVAKEDILTKTYDFLLYAIPQLGKFPRAHKFLIADRIENMLLDILEDYLNAYYSQKKDKASYLRENNLRLEKLRYLVRLSHDLRLLDHQKYGQFSEKIDEIGRMAGGWLKSLGKHETTQASV